MISYITSGSQSPSHNTYKRGIIQPHDEDQFPRCWTGITVHLCNVAIPISFSIIPSRKKTD